MTDDVLYPSSKPYNEAFLPVDNIHKLHYEEFGNPNGIPVVYLHGGPGGGSAETFHRHFDPAVFHIVVYDQRGAGKSTPFAEITNNSPDLLVEDLEKLKNHLGIDQWHVFGGSWGSTLALLYAEEYPESVSTLTLRGVFLMREKELTMLYKDCGNTFPAEYKALVDFLPENERGDLLDSYYKRLIDPNPAVHIPAATAWTRFELAVSHLIPPSEQELQAELQNMSLVLGMARMETHFFVKHKFDNDNRILDNVDKIKDIPTRIIQGHYDVVCPPVSAWELHQAMPKSRLELVISGHASSEPPIRKLLVKSANNIRDFGTPLPQKTPATAKVKKPPAFKP